MINISDNYSFCLLKTRRLIQNNKILRILLVYLKLFLGFPRKLLGNHIDFSFTLERRVLTKKMKKKEKETEREREKEKKEKEKRRRRRRKVYFVCAPHF